MIERGICGAYDYDTEGTVALYRESGRKPTRLKLPLGPVEGSGVWVCPH